jgi:hypothetical protein
MSSHYGDYKIPEWLTVQELARIFMIEPTEIFELELQAFLTRNEWPWMVGGRVAVHPIAVQPDAKYHAENLMRFCHTIESMQEDYKLLDELPTYSDDI